jgi:hypothetical protein
LEKVGENKNEKINFSKIIKSEKKPVQPVQK